MYSGELTPSSLPPNNESAAMGGGFVSLATHAALQQQLDVAHQDAARLTAHVAALERSVEQSREQQKASANEAATLSREVLLLKEA